MSTDEYDGYFNILTNVIDNQMLLNTTNSKPQIPIIHTSSPPPPPQQDQQASTAEDIAYESQLIKILRMRANCTEQQCQQIMRIFREFIVWRELQVKNICHKRNFGKMGNLEQERVSMLGRGQGMWARQIWVGGEGRVGFGQYMRNRDERNGGIYCGNLDLAKQFEDSCPTPTTSSKQPPTIQTSHQTQTPTQSPLHSALHSALHPTLSSQPQLQKMENEARQGQELKQNRNLEKFMKSNSQQMLESFQDKQQIEELKEIIQKLERELRQMEILGDLAKEELRIVFSNLRDKELQMFEMETIKNARIQELEQIICSREQQIYLLKQHYKSNPHLTLSQPNIQPPISYNKSEHSSSSQDPSEDPSQGSSSDSSQVVHCPQQKQDFLEVELEILKCKYKMLEKIYFQLKNGEMGMEIEGKSVGVQVEDFQDVDVDDLNESESNRSQTNPPPLQLSTTSSPNNPSTSATPKSLSPTSTHSNWLLDTKSLQRRISGYNFNKSILNRINNSKFIENQSKKMALIVQLFCYLEMYFNSHFLAFVLQELVLGGDHLGVRELKDGDLKFKDCSGLSQSSRVLSLSEKKHEIKNRLSLVHTFSQSIPPTPKSSPTQLTELAQLQHILSTMPTKPPTSKQLESQLFSLNLHKTKLSSLVISLMQENESIKKYLQILQSNQEELTNTNNQIYFQEAEQADVGGSRREIGQDKNCGIM